LDPIELEDDNSYTKNVTTDHKDNNAQIKVDNKDHAAIMEERYGPHTSNYNLQPQYPRQHSHLHATEQMHVWQGLKKFSEAGIQALQ
jgi:uncharacterized membrane protein YvbJ